MGLLVSRSKRPRDEEKTEKYDPVGILNAALAGAGTGSEVRLGGYAISVYWARQTLEALHGSKAENR